MTLSWLLCLIVILVIKRHQASNEKCLVVRRYSSVEADTSCDTSFQFSFSFILGELS